MHYLMNAGIVKSVTIDISKDRIIELCERCLLPKVCEKWGTIRELTCFCLESIFRISELGNE